MGPANKAANPLSVEFSDISSTRTACCFPKTSIRGKLSIFTSLRNNCPTLRPISCNRHI